MWKYTSFLNNPGLFGWLAAPLMLSYAFFMRVVTILPNRHPAQTCPGTEGKIFR